MKQEAEMKGVRCYPNSGENLSIAETEATFSLPDDSL